MGCEFLKAEGEGRTREYFSDVRIRKCYLSMQ